ncbi:MAG: phage virion morphogenesis protein [Desulfobacteraceae bacterium 4572_35.1]|nr:MAG: phage virion morphogenesis protein [Desulfobacteraceae bacterium 4572_35.1]
MAGAGFKMDLSQLHKMVGGGSPVQLNQALCEELGEMLASSSRQRFKDEQGPDGEDWKKSRRAQEEGGQTLSDDGILKNSIGYEASDSMAIVGTNDIRAAIHNYGGVIKPKSGGKLAFNIGGRTVFTDKVTMPKRQFIGISEEDKEEAKDIIQNDMHRRFGLK